MNHTLQEIFEIIEGREWDNFNESDNNGDYYKMRVSDYKIIFTILNRCGVVDTYEHYSLPDLLANPSWCKAVWGVKNVTECCEARSTCPKWRLYSRRAFQILQQEGEQACLNYIFSSMKK